MSRTLTPVPQDDDAGRYWLFAEYDAEAIEQIEHEIAQRREYLARRRAISHPGE